MKKNLFFTYIVLSSLTPYIIRAQSGIFQAGTFSQIATGFGFTEGPVWPGDGNLYFSDISGNTLYKWNEQDGAAAYLTPSGNSNGIALKNGKFIIAQHGNRQIARVESNLTITPLAGYYEGKRLNSPNDVVVKSDGKIYFTDPPYGITPPEEELGFNGVYYYDEALDTLVLLTDTMNMPNGLAFSPDESKLYVNDSYRKKVNAYTLNPDGTFLGVYIFAILNDEIDGIKTDAQGNVYVATAFGGVKVFNDSGALIDSLPVPEKMTNLNWGGNDGKTLFITSGTSIYSVVCSTGGVGVFSETEKESSYNIFPNPFSEFLNIEFVNETMQYITFTVSDNLGRVIMATAPSCYTKGSHSVFLPLYPSHGKKLNPGTYFLEILTGNKKTEHKIIKI